MPFIEIQKTCRAQAYIREDKISISKDIRTLHLKNKKIKVFYDEDKALLGLKPDVEGYKLSSNGDITCRKLPNIERGKYPIEWSDSHEMLIIDLTKKTMVS